MYKLCIAVVTLLSVNFSQHQCAENSELWSYSGDYGPSNWGGQCNKGNQQTPIDIPLNGTRIVSRADRGFQYVRYDTPLRGQVINNGHTVQIEATDDTSRGLNVKDFIDYKLLQFHFHFGDESNPNEGSEHTIDGMGYAMEMHLVHQDKADSKNLAVVGILFEETSEDNENLTALVNAINKVEYKGQKKQFSEPIRLDAILPKCISTFYRYTGSTTTPNCQEKVMWTVYQPTVSISTEQLKAFRKQRALQMKDSIYGCNPGIAGNFRPTQPLNGRSVTLYDPDCTLY